MRARLVRIAGFGVAVGASLSFALASVLAPQGAATPPDDAVAFATAALHSPSAPRAERPAVAEARGPQVPPLPPDSGQGRRIVFDQSEQRVWLVEADGSVDRSYLVSGSRFDNLRPGTYRVLSRQRHAVSFDLSGTMEYFVHFTTGRRAPIGFHAIPVFNDGTPEQTVAELGRPLSAGCIRQKKSDARYLWRWAPLGTTVVVTA